jgi:hypothetical protein
LITKKKEALGASCGYLYWCQGTKSLAHQRREYPDKEPYSLRSEDLARAAGGRDTLSMVSQES